MKKLILLSILCVGIIAFTSCSKDDGPGGSKGKTGKFTISAPGLNLEEDDQVIITFTGGSGTGGSTTAWKVNGITQSNQVAIRIETEMFAGGKTVVVETATPLEVMAMVVGGINYGEPFTLKFKAEVNGKVENDISESVVETFSKQLSY